MKVVLGLALGFAIGFFCRYLGVPVPAPPVLHGAILVVSMTLGFLLADRVASQRAHTTRKLCAGPTGKPHSQDQGD